MKLSVKNVSEIFSRSVKDVEDFFYPLIPTLQFLENKLFSKVIRRETFLIDGLVKNSDSNMVTTFIGNERDAYRFALVAYSGRPNITRVKKIPYYRIDLYDALNEGDIVFVQAERTFLETLRNRGYILMPNVSFKLDLSPSENHIFGRMHMGRKRDIAKIKEIGYSYKITTDNDHFDFFYSKMYVPYTKAKFKEGAIIKPRKELKALYQKGGLLLVMLEEKYISGTLYYKEGKSIIASVIGFYEGNEKCVRNFAGQATLYFLIKWSKEHGFAELDYGVSWPFLREGVFKYKKQWGTQVTERTDHSIYAFKLRNTGKGAMSFLLNNPFIFIDNKGMKGVVFVNHEISETELKKIVTTHFVPGILSLTIVSILQNKSYHVPNISVKVKGVDSVLVSSRGKLPPSLRHITEMLNKQGFTLDLLEVGLA